MVCNFALCKNRCCFRRTLNNRAKRLDSVWYKFRVHVHWLNAEIVMENKMLAVGGFV